MDNAIFMFLYLVGLGICVGLVQLTRRNTPPEFPQKKREDAP